MTRFPNQNDPLVSRARRFARSIAAAVVLTFAALLFLYATLSGEPHLPSAIAVEPAPSSHTGATETGSLPQPPSAN